MKRPLVFLFILVPCLFTSCAVARSAAGDPGPIISAVTTSTKSFSIDCVPTSVKVTAHITDATGLRQVQLWYRVGSDRPYGSLDMVPTNGSDFSATVQGSALPPDRYGSWEFYVSAEDTAGYGSKTPVDSSVQFLPCLSH